MHSVHTHPKKHETGQKIVDESERIKEDRDVPAPFKDIPNPFEGDDEGGSTKKN